MDNVNLMALVSIPLPALIRAIICTLREIGVEVLPPFDDEGEILIC
jgi:hypothetical protein